MSTSMETKTVRPIGSRLLVRRDEAKNKTPGGIVLPETGKEKPRIGMVKAAGKGATDDKGNTVPMDVKVGDKILFSSYAGTEVKVNGELHLIIESGDVLAIIDGNEDVV